MQILVYTVAVRSRQTEPMERKEKEASHAPTQRVGFKQRRCSIYSAGRPAKTGCACCGSASNGRSLFMGTNAEAAPLVESVSQRPLKKHKFIDDARYAVYGSTPFGAAVPPAA